MKFKTGDLVEVLNGPHRNRDWIGAILELLRDDEQENDSFLGKFIYAPESLKDHIFSISSISFSGPVRKIQKCPKYLK